MKVAVISGRYPATRFASAINHRAYCNFHGYTYIYCPWPTPQANPYMNKIEYIREYYDLFEYIFWIDDDAFFLNFDWRLESILPDEHQFLTICKSPSHKILKTYISSGQFLLRCNAKGRQFIDRLLTLDLENVRAWWSHQDYFFSGGDQDKMTYLLHCDENFRDGAKRLDHTAFNSRFEELATNTETSKINILHFTGRVPVKLRHYKAAQRLLGRGPSLLSKEFEAGFKIRRRGFFELLARFLQ